MSTSVEPRSALRTHDVENQPPALQRHNAYTADRALQEAVARGGASWATESLVALGDAVGDPANVEAATLANRHGPELRRFDGYGRRVDTVEFHPAWHHIMGLAYRHDVAAAPWREPRAGCHVAKAARSILFNELEGGSMCPVAITYGSIPLIRQQPELAKIWDTALLSKDYDGRDRPLSEKTGATAAFAVTEKQGGSDIRRNTTRAKPVSLAGPAREYLLTGHKWFLSAAGADVIFMTAQTERGPGLFLVPRWLPDGGRNPIDFERLKDKMGNRSNASAEIELDGTHGWLIGEEGRGIATMMVFLHHTRFEVSLAPIGEMRAVYTRALHHVRHRSTFGKVLSDQPLMRNVLADLAIDYEAAVSMGMRIGRAFDASATSEPEKGFARIGVALTKYWLCKRAVAFIQEAMEVHGGVGYIEESILPRFYREAAVNNIWEGSGNVLCLDILRTLRVDAAAREALSKELEQARGGHRDLDAAIDEVQQTLDSKDIPEGQARHLAERMALALQGALLVRESSTMISDAFCAGRLGAKRHASYGSLPPDVRLEEIISRSMDVSA